MKYEFSFGINVANDIISKEEKSYIITDEEGRIIDPVEIKDKLNRIDYLESKVQKDLELQNIEKQKEIIECLVCGDDYWGNRYAEHFCSLCKKTKEDLKFKKWIEQFKDKNNNKIEIMKIISYLYKLENNE